MASAPIASLNIVWRVCTDRILRHTSSNFAAVAEIAVGLRKPLVRGFAEQHRSLGLQPTPCDAYACHKASRACTPRKRLKTLDPPGSWFSTPTNTAVPVHTSHGGFGSTSWRTAYIVHQHTHTHMCSSRARVRMHACAS